MKSLVQKIGTTNTSEIKNNLYCRITIRLGDEVVSKMDVGVPSNFESEKGECSDAFKRCAVKFGIGRDLYHVGTLYAQCNPDP